MNSSVECNAASTGLERAEKETRIRIDRLRQGTVSYRRPHRGHRYGRRWLANKLEACLAGKSCHCPACPVCGWKQQQRRHLRLVELFAPFPVLFHVTLIHERYMCNVGELEQMSGLLQIKNTIRKQFQRKELSRGAVVAGCEPEYCPDLQKWVLHTHLLVGGLSRHELERLRGYYAGKSPTGSHRMRVQEVARTVADFERVFSYPFKWRTYIRNRIERPDGTTDRGPPRRPPAAIEDELLLFLASQTFETLTYTIGLGARGALWNGARVSRKPGVPATTGWTTYTPPVTADDSMVQHHQRKPTRNRDDVVTGYLAV